MASDTLPDRLELAPIGSLADVEAMRVIRNGVRDYMTHNKDFITPEQQEDWYFDTYMELNGDGDMYAYLARFEGRNVGYGIIQTIDDKKWVTGALTAAVRGRGLGEDLFRNLTQNVHDMGYKECWLDVLAENERAYNLYRKIGYCVINNVNGLIIMKHENEVQSGV